MLRESSGAFDSAKADYASHQLPADHVESHLRGEPTHSLAVAGEVSLFDLGFPFAGQGVVDQPYRFLLTAAAWTGHAGDPDAECRFAALANSLRHGDRHLAADGAVLVEQAFRDVCEGGFQLV